jgi:hypothetical protein
MFFVACVLQYLAHPHEETPMRNTFLLALTIACWSTAQASEPMQAVPSSATASASVATNGEQIHPRALLSGLLNEIRAGMPPLDNLSILPVVKKVYPTGEKPLVIVSFKCPTEVIGIAPPTVKLLHGLVDLGANGLNKSNLLSFDIQQVCS